MTSDLVAAPDPDSPGLVAITRSGQMISPVGPSVRFNERPAKGLHGVYGVLSRIYPFGGWTLTWRAKP